MVTPTHFFFLRVNVWFFFEYNVCANHVLNDGDRLGVLSVVRRRFLACKTMFFTSEHIDFHGVLKVSFGCCTHKKKFRVLCENLNKNHKCTMNNENQSSLEQDLEITIT